MFARYYKVFTFMLLSLALSSCTHKRKLSLTKNVCCCPGERPESKLDSTFDCQQPVISETKEPAKPAIEPNTVFIHGTLFHVKQYLVHALDCQLGFNHAEKQRFKFLMGHIPHILSKADPEEFPLKNFYLYGWSGSLSFEKRKEAALDLYHHLKKLSGPITLIGHSHGANVALNLAEIAQEHNDTEFKIDRLIMLAGPVQEATAHLIKSPIFKRIYSIYSTADMLQILDPQGTYKETKKISKEKNQKAPFFSKRTFEAAPNLIQIRIFLDWQSPSHIGFILKRFIKKLPLVLKIVDQAITDPLLSSEDNHYFVNIPRVHRKPHIVPKDKVPPYIPRSDRKKKNGQPL